MIAQLGQLFLHFAWLVGLVSLCIPAILWIPQTAQRLQWMRRASLISWGSVTLAFAALLLSFAMVDNSVYSVAMHAHPLQPMLYRIGAAWGHHEGSMLLWSWLFASYIAVYVLIVAKGSDSKLEIATLWTLNGLLWLFLWFVIDTSNPLVRILADNPGRGLTPVLQDPALAIHPPILYAGYVGTAIPFALTIGGLYAKQISLEWKERLLPWVRISWTCLTVGILLGSMWAYRELGWGGFWFWDPVENASLLPWLLLTALLHHLIVQKDRLTLPHSTVLFALLSFITVLLGLFLVRSGVLSSVHSFAHDAYRGALLLGMVALAFFAAMGLYLWRAPSIPMVSSSSWLLWVIRGQSWVLTLIALSLLLAILLPLYAELVQHRQISISLPYFEHSTIPLAIPLLLLMVVATGYAFKRQAISAAVAGLGSSWFILHMANPSYLLALFTFLSLWLALSLLWDLYERKITWAMCVGHLGLALLFFGIAWTTTQSEEETYKMQQGGAVSHGEWHIRYDGTVNVMQENYMARRATVWVSGPGGKTAPFKPEVRFYPIESQYSIESAIHRFGIHDVYVTIGNIQDNGEVTLRFYLRPAMIFVWAGGILLGVAGLLSCALPRSRRR